MKRIFISHRSTDKEYADALVQFLKNIGYSTDEIFYTSADSTGVNYYLGTEVKTALTESDIIIVILSKNYFKSIYCCNEMGYIWASNKPTFIFGLVGINNNNDYFGFMNNDWVVRKLTDRNDIFKFYELIIKEIPTRKNIVPTELNENIDVLNKMVCRIMECSAKQILTEMTNVKAEKIIDLDHLIEAKYYSDIELLMFKFIIDKGYCFNDSQFNIWEKVSQWEKEMKLNKSLSGYVDTVLNSFVNKGFATYTKYSGDKLNSEYKLKDQIFRELLQIDDKTKSVLSRIEKKYKLSLIERMRIKRKNFAERMGISI